MGEQNFLQFRALLFHRIEYQREVAAGIDHRGFIGLFAHQQRAVLLERGDRNDCDFHATSTRRRTLMTCSPDSTLSAGTVAPTREGLTQRSVTFLQHPGTRTKR